MTAYTRLIALSIAGVTGTAALVAMRAFDRRYAPATMPEPERADGGNLASSVVGLGISTALLYAVLGQHSRSGSSLADGAAIGLASFGAGSLRRLLSATPAHPAWNDHFPEISGELLRHLAAGVTTAVVYRAIDTTKFAPSQRPASGQ